jgi:hypothetical protein
MPLAVLQLCCESQVSPPGFIAKQGAQNGMDPARAQTLEFKLRHDLTQKPKEPNQEQLKEMMRTKLSSRQKTNAKKRPRPISKL